MANRIGGPRADNLVGTSQADVMRGNGGNDTMGGRAGNDDMTGGSGNDRMFGELNDDVMIGELGNDLVNGGQGADQVFGGQGADNVIGGDGNDSLSGTGRDGRNDFAADTVRGGNGNDSIFGGDASSDTLFGDAGNDFVEVNNDRADGGLGNDTLSTFHADGRLTGGGGADRFDLHTQTNDGSGQTVVTDFTTQDILSISAHDVNFNESFSGLALFDTLDTSGNGNLGGEDGFTTSAGGTFLGVSEDSDSLTIFVGDDSFDLLNVGNVSRVDWA